MSITLNEKELRLKELLMALPPDFSSIENLLSKETYTVENVSKVGTDFAWECVEECWEYFMEDDIIRSEEVVPDLHSTYICEVLTLLLRYGLDPNAIFEKENIMYHLQFLDNGYQAADALALLFEHGGNPNLFCESGNLFDDVDFSVTFDAVEQQDRQRYSSLVHCWMVCFAFGGRLKNGNAPIKVFRNFDVKELKNHRRFYFGITKGESWPDIHIFDKRNMWEVVKI